MTSTSWLKTCKTAITREGIPLAPLDAPLPPVFAKFAVEGSGFNPGKQERVIIVTGDVVL